MNRGGGSSAGSGSGKGSDCFYSVLEIRKDASFSDIRAAYRKLALKWHPDRWVKTPSAAGEANSRFQKIQEAYSVLSDKGKRSMYDAGLLELFDDDDDIEGMDDFLNELIDMMVQNGSKEETLEDLQKTYMELFGDDLKDMMEKEKREDPTVRKRACDSGSNTQNVPKRSARV